MMLRPLLKLLHQVSIKEDTSHPFIVGGVPRGKVLGNGRDVLSDIDVTTGDETIFHLAKEFSIKLGQHMPIITKHALDGHVSVYLKDLKIDFSSNFKVPGIEKILFQKGIKDPSPMQQEIYSRDFYCNTLLMSLDFQKIKDLTGEAIQDIKNKRIRTCLTPDLTLKYNTNRIIRVIYLAAKLDFNVEPNIIEWIKTNPDYILQSENAYITKNIDKALAADPDKTVYLLNKMNLWNYVPITQNIYPLYNKRKLQESVYVKK